MKIRTAFLIAAVIALALVIILGRNEAWQTLAMAFPLCLFTIAGGTLLIIRGKDVRLQLVGIAMIVSPLWLIPIFSWIVSKIAEMI